MDAKIHGSILCDAAPGIGEGALVIVDPSDVQKEYAEKMPYLAKVPKEACGDLQTEFELLSG